MRAPYHPHPQEVLNEQVNLLIQEGWVYETPSYEDYKPSFVYDPTPILDEQGIRVYRAIDTRYTSGSGSTGISNCFDLLPALPGASKFSWAWEEDDELKRASGGQVMTRLQRRGIPVPEIVMQSLKP